MRPPLTQRLRNEAEECKTRLIENIYEKGLT